MPPTGIAPPAAPVLLVGHGGMGRLYADALRAAGSLAGVLVGSEASAARLRAALAEPVDTDLDRLIGHLPGGSRPTALAVLSPTEWHAHHLRAALARGLPAMVIKPACVRPETARALAGEARAGGVAVLMAHEGVLQPQLVAILEAVAAGRIGAVREVQWLKEGEDRLSGGRSREPPRPEDEAGANFGHLHATCMHDLAVANRLAGRAAPEAAEVTEVFASATTPRLEATLRWPTDLCARLRHRVAPGLPFRRGLHVVGERGGLLWVMEAGRSVLQLRLGREVRDLPYRGFRGANPATPVVDAFLRLLAGVGPPATSPLLGAEDLDDGARALEAARLLTAAAARRSGVEVDLDAIAGGADR